MFYYIVLSILDNVSYKVCVSMDHLNWRRYSHLSNWHRRRDGTVCEREVSKGS